MLFGPTGTLKCLFLELLGGRSCYSLDESTRSAGGGRVSGIDGIGEKGDEGEEREGIQSRKAKLEVEQKLRDLSQRSDIWPGHLHLRFGRWKFMEHVKKGILLQLFGGTNKSVAKTGNILMSRLVTVCLV